MGDPTNADPALAAGLRRLRVDRDWTQEHLAHEAGLTLGTVGKIERGEMNPSWLVIRSFATAFGISPLELVAAVEAEES